MTIYDAPITYDSSLFYGGGSPLPVVQILVAFQNNPLDDPALITTVASPGVLGANNVWTDISAYVSGYDLSRGRQHELQQFEAGTCQFTLNNVDGRFSSWNASGPYYGFLLPRKLVQVRVTWGATTYTRFTGHVDAWPTDWSDPLSNFAKLHATDAFRIFNQADITTGGYPAQVIADGATGYWRFGDPVGSTRALDSSGNNRTAYMSGQSQGITWFVYGAAFGTAGALPANTGSAVGLGTSSGNGGVLFPTYTPSMTGITVEFWFQSPSGAQDVLNINSAFLSPFLDGGGLGLQWQVSTAGSTIATSLTYEDGLWHYFVWTLDGAHSTIYIDGAQVAQAADTTTSYTQYIPQNMFIENTSPNPAILMQEFAVYPSALNSTKIANHFNLATFPQEGTGARVGRVLNALGWSTGARAIDTGVSTVQAASGSLTTTSSLSHLQDVEGTEGGALFMNVDGEVKFLSRQTLFSNSLYTSSQATIGDNTAGGDMPFQPAPMLAIDDIDLYNEATATRQNGVTQITDSSTSITAYGRNTWSPPAQLIGISDTEVLGLTQYIVNKYQTPIERLAAVTVDLLELITPNLVGTLLGLDLLYRVTVERTVVPGGGTAFSQILNIEHIDESVTPDKWTVTFGMAVADPAWWILGTSQLGTGTRIAY